MKKIISLIIITFLLISCWQKKEEEVTACIDEGTITEDWTIVYSQDHSWCS